jgi:hypothetical protein
VGSHISVLFPVVYVAGNESTEPDMLDAAQELQSLRKTLKEAGRKLVFRAEVATVRNFRFLVRPKLVDPHA